MELKDAVELIGGWSSPTRPETWADLGCGSGLFTYALAHLLPPGSLVHAVDKSAVSLDRFPNPHHIPIQKKQLDFVKDSLDLTALDGVLMANSFHFVRDKVSFLNKLRQCLNADGHLLIVEYNTDSPNAWVPYPTGFKTLKTLLESQGYVNIVKVGERPSRYQNGALYAVLATLDSGDKAGPGKPKKGG